MMKTALKLNFQTNTNNFAAPSQFPETSVQIMLPE